MPTNNELDLSIDNIYIEASENSIDDFDFDDEDEIMLDDGVGLGIPENIDVLLINANIATFDNAFGYTNRYPKNYGSLHDAAIAIANGKVVWIGSNYAALDFIDTHESTNKVQVCDLQWRWITPGLIDCHTQLVYAGNVSLEFEANLSKKSLDKNNNHLEKYRNSVLSIVTATREVTEADLYNQSELRLKTLMKEGVTTVEIKSGFGLDLATERKILKVARQLGDKNDITVSTTYFAAHILPPEFENRSDEYINSVCSWMLELHDEGLIDAVDVSVEESGFNMEQASKVFKTAQSLGLPVKIQAEQTRNIGGSRIVSEYRGLASSHLDHLNEVDIEHLATSDVIAVMLPTVFYSTKQEVLPPIELIRQGDVNMSVASGCNPVTAPNFSLLLGMNMACNIYGLTPAEALSGSTFNAAKALGLIDKGRIAVGMDADLLIWNIDRLADLSYYMGSNFIESRMVNGKFTEV